MMRQRRRVMLRRSSAPRSKGRQALSYDREIMVRRKLSGVNSLLTLQRIAGNKTVQRLLRSRDNPEGGGVERVQRKDEAPAKGSCGKASLAGKVAASDKRLNGSVAPVDLDEKSFGNTSKLGADFRFGACKVDKNWRFYLDALVVPIASRVQSETFRINVPGSSDSAVTKESYSDIVKDLRPTTTVTFSISCGGNKFKDKVTTYSRREKYWNYQIVVDHEKAHRDRWMAMYRAELVSAESNIRAHSLPASEAVNPAGAIAKADAALTKYMTDAYQNTCKAYAPNQESRAYDDGAPQYQKLVDEIEARARKEKWK
jgi:hypothetical protein